MSVDTNPSTATVNQFELVARNSPDFIGVCDVNGKPIFVNDVAKRMVGITWEEMLCTSVPDYFVPEERDFVRDVVLPCVLSEGRWVGELTFQHFKTGARIPVLYDVFRIDDPQTGKPINFATITRDLTDQKKKDAQLRDARQRVTAVLEAAEVGTWTYEIGPDRVVADSNLARMFGVSPNDATDSRLDTYLRAIHPEDRPVVEKHIADAILNGRSFHIEYRIVQANGLFRHVIARGKVERDAKGKALRLPGVMVDITDRVRAEQGRNKISSEFEQRMRVVETMLSSIADFAYAFDRDGRFVYVNKPLLDLWGLTLNEAVGKNFYDLKYPDELAAKLQSQIQQVFTSKQVLSDETPYTSPSGEGGFYEYIFAPVFEADGSVQLVAGSTRDISARKNAAEEIARREAQFRQLADAMPQIVWAAQPDGTLDYYNRRWFEYINLNSNSLEEARWDQYIHPDDLQRAYEAWTTALRCGDPYGIEFRVKRADHQFRWFLVRALPIRDEHNTIVRWFGTCTDIQDQKELQSQNENLLDSERAARAAAERASHTKDEFLATLSHELRTPLAAILGWAQLLRRKPAEAEGLKQGLETIERNARVQSQLIEDLLDMSRIISGKLRLDIQQLQPVSIIEAAIETVMPAAAAKEIRIVKILDPNAGPISGDPSRLQQVVWNLLSNAIKFTPKGGNVQVVLERVNSHLELSIADTGMGILREFLPHVFERFRQADGATNRKFGGLGLGLAIVKQLAELHGGTVRVDSDGENQGTTFTVNLPLKAVHSHSNERESLADKAKRAISLDVKNSSLSGLKILIVDDERDARELLKRVLTEFGATVTMAGSATEGLEKMAAEKPDVLVSDIGMPEIDGYEFLKRVRALDPASGGRVPAVALTAFARSEDRTRALLAGYLAHVSKPVEPLELVASIATIVGRTGGGK